MRLFPMTALLVLAFAAFAVTANAQTDEDADAPATRWYGWQTLLVDTASISTMLAAIPLQSGPVAEAGLAGYAFGAPVVHAAHGQWGHALGSVALHVGVPTAGGMTGLTIGAATCSHDANAWVDWCEGTLSGLGVVLGAVIAPFLDAGLLGDEPVKDVKAVSIATSIGVDKNGAAFTFRGRF